MGVRVVMKRASAVQQAAMGVLAVAAIAAGVADEAVTDDWESITEERLLAPEPGDWLSYRRTYDVTGFSPLQANQSPQHRPAASRLDLLDARQQPLGADTDRRERAHVCRRRQRPRARVRCSDGRGRVDPHTHVPGGHRVVRGVPALPRRVDLRRHDLLGHRGHASRRARRALRPSALGRANGRLQNRRRARAPAVDRGRQGLHRRRGR